jgi:hypothetical protein
MGPCPAIQVTEASMFMSVAKATDPLQVEYLSTKNTVWSEADWAVALLRSKAHNGSVTSFSVLLNSNGPASFPSRAINCLSCNVVANQLRTTVWLG